MKIYNIKESVAPVIEPVTAAEVKSNSRVDHSTEDTLIEGFIQTAREHCEGVSGWAFITRTYTAQLDAWPLDYEIKLPFPPLQSVTSIAYTDDVGGSHTIPAADYVVDTHSTPGRVVLKDGATWPSETLQVGGAITITFVAGFGDAATDVPAKYKAAVKAYASAYYENREAFVVGQGLTPIAIPFVDAWLQIDGVYY